MSQTVIRLREWETRGPERGSDLFGLSLGADVAARDVARKLEDSSRLGVLELATGLRISATSFVGSLALGPVTIVINPKIPGSPLMGLLRYAYNLGNLDTYRATDAIIASGGFQDLLAHQLLSEAKTLLGRGLHRDYVRVSETLAVPRGRVDFQRYPFGWANGDPRVPCIHHPRLEDTVPNRVLLAGLRRAAALTGDANLRSSLRQLAGVLEPTVRAMQLSERTVQRTLQTMDRRHAHYQPAMTLIELLIGSEGVVLDDLPGSIRLPGFLFDMNRFFQSLLSRFLQEHLEGCVVRDEHRLTDLFSYEAGFNPRNRRAPTPRPDFAILQHGATVALLDAKYRDLWERPLPREMLYQLALYALSRPSKSREATILYPTLSDAASEQRIAFRDPVTAQAAAYVVLRPVNQLRLERLLATPGLEGQTARGRFASYLAFGA